MKKIYGLLISLLTYGISVASVAHDSKLSKNALVVLDSEYIYPTGHQLSLNQFISLACDRELDLQLPDGTTAVLKGPANGKVESLLKGKARIKTWASDLKATLLRKSNDKHVLITRGNGIVELWRPSSIPVPFSGNFCIQDSTSLSFFRTGKAEDSLSVEIKSSSGPTILHFPNGNDVEISWPDGLATTGQFELKHSAWFGEYRFEVLILQSMDVGSLARAGCSYQLKTFKRFANQ